MHLSARSWIAAVVLSLLAGCSDSPQEKFETYKAKAAQGDRFAQYELGFCYDEGIGVNQDLAQAVNWYRKAADQGHAPAQHNLANFYYFGVVVAKAPVQAISWYRKAAEQGHALAQYNLGVCYFNGIGVEKNQVQAVSWYRKAAEQGLAMAQYNLGICYWDGNGIAWDNTQSGFWTRKAAAQGYAKAQFTSPILYANEGTPTLPANPTPNQRGYFEYAKAKFNPNAKARSAVEQGHALDQLNKGLCFENKGALVGVSNPHPHGQVYATNFVFKTIETALSAMQSYARSEGRSLMGDIIGAEQRDGRRILFEDSHTIAFVPYFARYAYEVYIVPKRRVAYLHLLSDIEAASLAEAIKAVTVRFDNLWQMSFPYVMPIHQAPTDAGDYSDFHAYLTFHPPLRQPALLKYLAGPEVGGGNFLNDTSPEASAQALRAVSAIHYVTEGANQ